MPITFNKIANRRATITFTYEGEDIHVVYCPNKFTPRLIAQAQAGEVGDNEAFTDLIVSWDIYEDEEETREFPVSRIDELGPHFMYQLALAIGEDLQPPEAIAPQASRNGAH